MVFVILGWVMIFFNEVFLVVVIVKCIVFIVVLNFLLVGSWSGMLKRVVMVLS